MSNNFDPPASVLSEVVAAALSEDIGLIGDLTSIACIREDQTASAVLVAPSASKSPTTRIREPRARHIAGFHRRQ